jgi:peptide/nickel transport system permease protein
MRSQTDRRRRSLWGGGAVLALLLAANLYAYRLEPERGVEEFRFSPPTPRLLQRLLVRHAAHDVVVSSESTRDTTLSALEPMQAVRIHRPYRYEPAFTGSVLHNFELSGAPAGLVADRSTGTISGVPEVLGRFDVVLEAEMQGGSRIQRKFPLFVDDRYLVLGADSHGRDVLQRIVRGARYSVIPGLIAVLIGVGGGLLLGGLGGFYGGATQATVRVVISGIEAIPGLLLIFLAAVVSGFQLFTVMAAVGVTLLPETTRSLMQRVESFRQRDFVEAARELGQSDRAILWNEIVWHNARPLLVMRVTQAFVTAILIEITLGYMGLGVQDQSSLGSVLLEGRQALTGTGGSWVALSALGAVLLIVAAFSLAQRGLLGATKRHA